MRIRKWDSKIAQQLLAEGISDKEVAAKVGATEFAIRIFRLRQQYELTGEHRRYQTAPSDLQRPSYLDELTSFINKKAAENEVTPDDYKYWLFHTKEGIAYCVSMNQKLQEHVNIGANDD